MKTRLTLPLLSLLIALLAVERAGATATVATATGGSSISLDTTSSAGGTGVFTALTGPVITETDSAGMSVGTIILTAPSGFEFDTTADSVTVTVGSSGTFSGGAAAFINTSSSITGDANTSMTFTPTTTTITVYVTVASTQTSGTRLSTFTFSGIKVRPTGTTTGTGNITISGTSTGITGGSNMGTLIRVAGAANKLAFTTQPGGGTGGTAWATQPVVTLQDQFGNTKTGTAQNVTVAIQNNAGPGGTLATTLMVAVTTGTGLATFSGLKIDKIGTGYTLTATGSTVSTTPGVVVSSAFDITLGAAAKLAFSTSPSASTVAGVAFAAQPVVEVQDAGGNTVTTDTSTVTIAIGSNPGSGTLSGSLTKAAVAGVADFSANGLNINKAGTGYTLSATDGALTSATSGSFNIVAATAAQVAFATQPANTGHGNTMAAVTVQVQDALGNVVNSSADVTVAIGANPGSGTLGGTLTVAASSGTATFNNLTIDNLGTGYTLTANSSGLTGGTSSAFDIISVSRTASVTGPWNDNATWGGNSIPIAGDTVTVNSAITVTVPSGYAAACSTISFASSTTATSTIILADSTASLAASGAVTLPRPSSTGPGLNRINVGAGTFSAASVALSGSTGTRLTQILISTGTATISGNITSAGVDSQIVFSGAGTLNVGGTFMTGTQGTFTPSTGTVNFNSAGNITPLSTLVYAFNNLTISGGGIKTITTANTTVNGILSMEGTATLSATPTYGTTATLRYNTATARTAGAEWLATFAATGGVIIDNTGAITLNGNKLFNANIPLTIDTGATLNTDAANNRTLSLGGDFHNAGTLAANASAITISGGATAQSIDGFSTTGSLTINKSAGTATLAGNVNGGAFTMTAGTLNLGTGLTHTFTGTWTRTAGILQGGSSTLNVAGSTSGTGGTFEAGTSTVNYNAAGAQSVFALAYYNLTLTGTTAATKTLPAGTSVTGTLTTALTGSATATIASGANLSVGSLNLNGSAKGSGTWGSVTSSGANHASALFATSTGILTVSGGGLAPTITWPTAGDITYGQALTASTLSGQSSTPSGSFAFNPSTTVPSVGTASYNMLFVPSDDTYNTASSSVSVTVNKASLTVMAVDKSKTYNTANPTFTASYSGFVNGDTTGVLTGSPSLTTPAVTGSDVGGYTITAAVGSLSAANYSFSFVDGTLTINQATPTATLVVNNSPVTYDGNPHAATVQVSSSSTPGTVANILTGGAATKISPGTYAVTADFVPTSANYSTLVGLSAGNFLINPVITATAGANGTISPLGATPVTYNSSPVYTITPDSGYVVNDVLVDGVSQGTKMSYTFNSVVANHTIAVSFVALPVALSGTFTCTTNETDNKLVYVFTAASGATFTLTTNMAANILVVGGGGGGGGALNTASYFGGGGGAGGYNLQSGASLAAQGYTVTVGGGGTAGNSTTVGGNGTNSVFGAFTATGGGGGGSAISGLAQAGANGGSGGGGANRAATSSGTFGTGTAGQGNSGVAGSTVSTRGGGGGGATAAGSGANGGTGTANNITGTSVTYAGGGGAGGATAGTSGTGGVGAQGSGATGGNGVSGTANLGGGGGGGANGTSSLANRTGGVGGSGIVVVSLTLKATPTVTTWPTAGSLSYGQTLSSSALSPSSATVGVNASVAGTFAWTTSNTTPPVGTASYSVTFTPTDAVNYNPVVSTVSVTVSPANTTTAATAATATYNASSQNVTLSATVTSSPATVNEGTVTFTVFDGATQIGSPTTSATVSGGSASVSYALPAGLTPKNTYTIQAVYNAGANFNGSSDNTHTLAINPVITASTGGNGTVTPSGSTPVNYNGSQPYNIAPSPGYVINNVLVDGVSVAAVTSYTFTSVTANHTISATFVAIPSSATGSPTVTQNGNTVIYQFKTTGTWSFTPAVAVAADVLVVGGGGGGGGANSTTTTSRTHCGGGGGGGGIVSQNGVSLTGGTLYDVIVGAGGTVSSGAAGNTGDSSSISGTGLTTITGAGGGGGGAGVNNATSGGSGAAGGGGGSFQSGASTYVNGNGGSGSPYNGASAGNTVGGGGGGDGAAANNGSQNGGIGVSSSISGGSPTYYGGGGGGGAASAGTGGNGGGGNGRGSSTGIGTVGSVNTGGGGGGAYVTGSSQTARSGGIGGSGIVIISYTAKANPTVTVTPGSYTYNGSAQGPGSGDVNKGGSTGGVALSYSGTLNGGGSYSSSTPPTAAGSYTVTATVAADSSYNQASSSATVFTIARAASSVSNPTVGSYTYSGSPQGPNSGSTPTGSAGAITYSYEGTPNVGDSYGPSSTAPTAAGSYTVTATVAQDNNYNQASSSATAFTIGNATVTITSGLTADNKVYDTTTTATLSSNSVVLAGVVSGDLGNVGLSTNGYSATFADSNVGPGITVTVAGLTLTGSAAGNYTLTQPSYPADITAATVTVTSGLTADNKVYDTTTTATLSSNDVVLAGVLTGDLGNVDLSTNGYSATFADSNVGPGISVTVADLTLTGSAAGNYTLTQPTFAANITAAATALTVVSSQNPSGFKSAVSFTATNLPVDATGSVLFLTNGAPFSTNALASGGATSASTIVLPRGTIVITAEFASNGNYIGSTNTLNQVVTNHPPAVASHNLGATLNTVLNVSATTLAGLDYDADGDSLTVTAVSGTSTNGATVSLDGTTITYTPVTSYVGADRFTYTISDGNGGTNTCTLRVNVRLGKATSVFNSITAPGVSTINLQGYGIPSHTYDVQKSTESTFPSNTTTTLGTATAAANGVILFTDTNAIESSAFYRFAVQ